MSTTINSTTAYWKSPTATTETSTSGTNNLSDFQSFVELLATELQYQDPTDPVDSTEFVAQMSQISMLQQLQSMTASMDAVKAYAMLGSTATYSVIDSAGNTTTATGTVQSVMTRNNTVYVTIDGNTVELSAVTQVSA